MSAIQLLAYPRLDAIHVESAGGAYFWNGDSHDPWFAQVIVVGPLLGSVNDYQKAAENAAGADLELCEDHPLEIDVSGLSKEEADRARSRGFHSFMFRVRARYRWNNGWFREVPVVALDRTSKMNAHE